MTKNGKDQTTTTPAPAPAKKRSRGPRAAQYRLVEVSEDTTGRTVYVLHDLPPFPPGKPITSTLIKEACETAVYRDGRKEFGNKRFEVFDARIAFTVPYVERSCLAPPPPEAKP